jgi:L-fuculose-phosphate aldolase
VLLADERDAIAEACRTLRRDGLVVGTAGNVSVRVDDLVAISPSGVDYTTVRAGDVGVHRIDGTPVEAPLRPSSEFPLHLAVYRERDVAAIVHTHGVASTAMSTVVDEVPASHYYTALFGGGLRVAPYARFGSDELAAGAVAALADRTGALLGNHGALTVGASLAGALDLVAYLEYVCDVQLRALATGLPVRTLPAEEIAAVAVAVRGYGQRSAAADGGGAG